MITETAVHGSGRGGTRVTHAGLHDSVETPKLGVRAPESAHAEGGALQLARAERFVDAGGGEGRCGGLGHDGLRVGGPEDSGMRFDAGRLGRVTV